MKRYGNIRFTRRVVVALCMLIVAVSVLMPAFTVRADTKYSFSIGYGYCDVDGFYHLEDGFVYHMVYTSSPVYCFIEKPFGSTGYNLVMYCCGNQLSAFPSFCNAKYDSERNITYFDKYLVDDNMLSGHPVSYYFTTDYCKKNGKTFYFLQSGKPIVPTYVHVVQSSSGAWYNSLDSITGSLDSGILYDNDAFNANDKAFSVIGCLDNVQMETYVTNKKELIDADENADLSKINQDKVIVYSSTSTTGIDLSKGGYKVQLYGSYAWQDKSGNIKSEDKGHKTFIKDWNAENNIKGLNRSNYTWIDWKSANDKVESDKTDNAHKPNVFEKMTTYGNYQFEPIWYLRIVSKDNKYGAWVKLYNSTKKGKYTSEAVDDNDNSVSDSDGGYSKPKDTSEITGTGDTPEDAKNNVQKTEEKQDNKDIQDASGGSNSTFDKLEEFTKGIGDVPKMIADIFSFLPSWCLEVVAIGFALLMILIVVKFIRG